MSESIALYDHIILVGLQNGYIELWSSKTKEHIKSINAHHEEPVKTLTTYKNMIISGSWDKTIKLWNLNTGELIQTLTGHSSGIKCLKVYKDIVVSGSFDNSIKLWNLNTGKCLKTIEGHTDSVLSIAIYDDIIVSGSKDKTIKLWDFKTGECLKTLTGHNYSVGTLAIANGIIFSGSSDNNIGSSKDKTIKYWDLKTGELLLSLYNTSKGFLWESPPEKGFPHGKFYTDRPDLIQVYECNEHDDSDAILLPTGDETREAYISVHNDKNIMLRINNLQEYEQKAREYLHIKKQTQDFNKLTSNWHEFKMLETRPKNDERLDY